MTSKMQPFLLCIEEIYTSDVSGWYYLLQNIPQRRSNFSHNLLTITTFLFQSKGVEWFWGHMKIWLGNIPERLFKDPKYWRPIVKYRVFLECIYGQI